jgi:hypothetical protein
MEKIQIHGLDDYYLPKKGELKMTPNDIEVLLHCHCSLEPHPRNHAPAVEAALGMFIRQGIIECGSKKDTFNVTERGAVLVQMLCDTPFPITNWTDPRI